MVDYYQSGSAVLDALRDLKHDLGKYLLMPIAYMPANVSAPVLRQQVEQALFSTRRKKGEPVSAKALWKSACRTLVPDVSAYKGWAAVEAAVAKALSYEQLLADVDADMARDAVYRDFAAVSESIAQLIAEVEDGR